MKRARQRWASALSSPFVLVLLALSVSCSQVASAQTQNGEGDGWMKWNSDTRLGFVWGYTMGLNHGFGQGCGAYYKAAQPEKPHSLRDDPLGKCISKGLGFSKPPAFYEKKVTDFYTSFPEDRDVPFEQVLKWSSDSENISVQQMHERAKEHGHTKWVNTH
jgi:hypothetical protein